jgi:hypothetical protein
MTSPPKRLLSFATILGIGLAGSSVFALAQAPAAAPAAPGPIALNGPIGQGPPPFKCQPGEWSGTIGHGTDDSFAGGTEPTSPSAAFKSIPGLNLTTSLNTYDQPASTSNYHFGDTLTFNPPPGTITRARLTTRLRPNSGDAINDGISFFYNSPTVADRFGFAINSLPGASPWQPPHAPVKFTFEFPQTGNVQVWGNGSGFPPAGPPYNGPAFFAGLNAHHALDVYVQDDTSVDFLQLQLCVKLDKPKYDLVASKKHDGNVYILNVFNAGQQINPTGRVDVVEIVPVGLTITSFPGAPWTCTGSPPVVGPDAFTCSYQVPPGGVAANSSLPPIVLKSEGQARCPNCMRVRLFLREVADGQKPVDEGDMKNNWSCVD